MYQPNVVAWWFNELNYLFVANPFHGVVVHAGNGVSYKKQTKVRLIEIVCFYKQVIYNEKLKKLK